MRTRAIALLTATLAAGTLLAACSSGASAGGGGDNTTIQAVGAENEYADVIHQIGGQYVNVTSIMSNPNTDPHTFEASAKVGTQVREASLVVQNGLGYDDFMNNIENGAPNPNRTVIDVQKLRGLPDSTSNPHLWYDPATMPAVAKAVESALSKAQPDHASYFQANEATFEKSFSEWTQALAAFKQDYPNTPVAVTEPVADYMLTAAGTNDLTPTTLQEAIEDGTDPAPQSVSAQTDLLTGHKVKVFLYNQQVTDDLTQTWLSAAKAAGVPVVGVYETMPTPGYTYQSWMLAEVKALRAAVANGVSTEKL